MLPSLGPSWALLIPAGQWAVPHGKYGHTRDFYKKNLKPVFHAVRSVLVLSQFCESELRVSRSCPDLTLDWTARLVLPLLTLLSLCIRTAYIPATTMSSSDVEKNPANSYYEDPAPGAVPGESFEYGDSYYAKLQRFAGKFKVEQRGIERVPEDERTDTSLLNVGSMVRLFLDSEIK
jgi:hypothetical protein